MFVGMLMRAQFRCSLEQLGIAASRRGGRRHRGRRGCARRRDCPRLAKSEDARAVLRGPGLPGPFPVQLRELAPLQYQLIKSVQTLVEPLAGNRAGRLHPDARASRHPRQFQYAQVLFQFAHLFGTCGHREEPVQPSHFQQQSTRGRDLSFVRGFRAVRFLSRIDRSRSCYAPFDFIRLLYHDLLMQ